MQIAVKATQAAQTAFLSKGIPETVSVVFVEGGRMSPTADAYFDLSYEEEGAAFAAITNKPVFVNAVTETCETLPANFIRINAWNGFLERALVEIAIAKENPVADRAIAVLDTMQWRYQLTPDVPGMIAARVIAMIINEAYFGLGDEISSKTDIDTAMKLGTNYPYGPFEWCEKIGIHKIFSLLCKLQTESSRYAPAPALLKEAQSK
ncbi:MAG: 3-hydroxyacyl-CoA dehydrogenase family protein [Bacteroidota bacterium]